MRAEVVSWEFAGGVAGITKHSWMHQSGRLAAVGDEAPARITHTYTDACQSRRLAAGVGEASWWRGSRDVGHTWIGAATTELV